MKFHSPRAKTIILTVGVIAVALVIFEAGVFAGYRRGSFSSHWQESYARGMDDPHSAFAPFMRRTDDPSPHGVAGNVISVDLPTFVVKGRGPEEIVLVSSSTAIRWMRGQAAASDIKTGTDVVVIGSPGDDGKIDAAFVRIIPHTSANMSSTSGSSAVTR